MSQMPLGGPHDTDPLSPDETEVREALLDHSDESYHAWISTQLDADEERARNGM